MKVYIVERVTVQSQYTEPQYYGSARDAEEILFVDTDEEKARAYMRALDPHESEDEEDDEDSFFFRMLAVDGDKTEVVEELHEEEQEEDGKEIVLTARETRTLSWRGRVSDDEFLALQGQSKTGVPSLEALYAKMRASEEADVEQDYEMYDLAIGKIIVPFDD